MSPHKFKRFLTIQSRKKHSMSFILDKCEELRLMAGEFIDPHNLFIFSNDPDCSPGCEVGRELAALLTNLGLMRAEDNDAYFNTPDSIKEDIQLAKELWAKFNE